MTYEKARLLDTLIRQKHEEGQVTLTMTTDVEKDADAKVTLTYEVLGSGWKAAFSRNGSCCEDRRAETLDGRMETESSPFIPSV